MGCRVGCWVVGRLGVEYRVVRIVGLCESFFFRSSFFVFVVPLFLCQLFRFFLGF